MPEGIRARLSERALRAGGWTALGFGVGQAIRFGGNLVMTRLLVPEAFGVLAIATAVMVGLTMFSDMGLRLNVVRSRRGDDPLYLNTVWAIQILRGLLLWGVAIGVSAALALAAGAGWVPAESVYADPALPYVIAALSVSLLVLGFESTRVAQASRALRLRDITLIELGSQVFGLGCMLGWAVLDRSVWALVAGNLCANAARVALSHAVLAGARNRWQWDPQAFREVLAIGKWIFVSSIMGFVVRNGDRLLLGALVGPAALGVYAIAHLIFSAVEQVFGRIVTDVAYPALSEVVRERPADLRKSYYRPFVPIAALAYFGGGVLMTAGEPAVALLYDARYREAGWILEVLAAALLSVPCRIAAECFIALGRPRIFSAVIALQLAALLLLVPGGFALFGLHGAAWGVALSYLVTVPLVAYFQIRHSFFDARKELLLGFLAPAGALAGAGAAAALG